MLSSKIKNKKKLAIKKSAKIADSLEFRNNPINPALTSKNSIAHQNNLSSDNIFGGGSAGNRTPETLMSNQSSDHPGPTAVSLYQNKFPISNKIPNPKFQTNTKLKIKKFR